MCLTASCRATACLAAPSVPRPCLVPASLSERPKRNRPVLKPGGMFALDSNQRNYRPGSRVVRVVVMEGANGFISPDNIRSSPARVKRPPALGWADPQSWPRMSSGVAVVGGYNPPPPRGKGWSKRGRIRAGLRDPRGHFLGTCRTRRKIRTQRNRAGGRAWQAVVVWPRWPSLAPRRARRRGRRSRAAIGPPHRRPTRAARRRRQPDHQRPRGGRRPIRRPRHPSRRRLLRWPPGR